VTDWRQPWIDARDRVLGMYGPHLGRPVTALQTPALLVDEDLMR
jgi:hypothetical protein